MFTDFLRYWPNFLFKLLKSRTDFSENLKMRSNNSEHSHEIIEYKYIKIYIYKYIKAALANEIIYKWIPVEKGA